MFYCPKIEKGVKMSKNISNMIYQKLFESYMQATANRGVKNTEDLEYSQIMSKDGLQALFTENDGDIFYSKYDDDTNISETRYISQESAQKLLKSGSFGDIEDLNDAYQNEINALYSNSSNSNSYHKAGTGSSQARIDVFQDLVPKLPSLNTFQNEDGTMSRQKIQEWLDDNGYSSTDKVDGGFNVDDVFAYLSTTRSQNHEKLYFHLLANEAWLDKGADGDNDVDGYLSNQEVYNFYNDRFGIDITNKENITNSQAHDWQDANKAVGSTLHENYNYVGLYNFADKYYSKYTTERKDDDSYTSNKYDGDYRYENNKISKQSLNSTTEISNFLNNLQKTGDYEASIKMDDDVELYDVNSKSYITLDNGKKYDITKITGTHVFLDVDGETVKVKRGNSSTGFEGACKNAIQSALYSADKKISTSSSSSTSNNYDDYRYENRRLSSINFNSATKVSNILDNLKNEGNFEASVEMQKDVSLYDMNSQKYVKLYDGDKYDITKITNSYVYLDVDGKEVKVKRGTTQDGFENRCKNAIDNMVYSADNTISSSKTNNTTSNTNTNYNNHSLKSSTPERVKSLIDRLQNADSFKASISISNKNWFDEDSKTILSVGDYEIKMVTSKYVLIEDEYGEEYKIPRGTDEYGFEWYCSKENTQSTSRFTAEIDD